MSTVSFNETGAASDERMAQPAGARNSARRARHVGRVVKPLVLLAALIGVWQLVVDTGALPKFEVAAPSTVASYIGAHPAQLLSNAGTTVEEVIIAFAFALVGGLILAMLINHFKVLNDAFLPLLVVSQVVPAIAIAPLLVLLLGFGIAPKVAVAAIISFFPIVINTLSGLRGVSGDMETLSTALGSSPWRKLRLFTLPNSLPYVFAGCRLAVTLSVIGAVVGEFITAKNGLGYLVLEGSSQLNPPLMFAALVVLAILGIVLFSVVRAVEYVSLPWTRVGRL